MTTTPFIDPEQSAVIHRPFHGGDQWIYTFANHQGASVVCHNGSYGGSDGLFEVAVLDSGGSIDYSTHITDDVIGYLTADDVSDTLEQIAALPVPIA